MMKEESLSRVINGYVFCFFNIKMTKEVFFFGFKPQKKERKKNCKIILFILFFLLRLSISPLEKFNLKIEFF